MFSLYALSRCSIYMTQAIDSYTPKPLGHGTGLFVALSISLYINPDILMEARPPLHMHGSQ